ncbi:MAG: hypothetical protein WED34_19300 [Planctomycetales bacterium]
MALTGCNFVRFTRHGLQSMRHHWGRMGDRFEVRRQALKLRFWDERHEHPPGMLLDHSYESIKALPGLSIYELRVDDEIGGQSNIRVVFFDPPKDWHPSLAEARPMRTVWVLEALPKKRMHWTKNELTRFRTSRLLLRKRCYE